MIRWSTLRWIGIVLAISVLTIGAFYWSSLAPSGDSRSAASRTTAPREANRTDPDSPTPTSGAGHPLGRPAPLPPGADQMKAGRDFEFLTIQANDPSTPVTYDPCRPIHYVVNDRTALPGSRQVLRDAIQQVSTATGLVFVDDGATNEVPVIKRELFQPQRYGDRWAPVLLAWSDEAELSILTPDSFGSGGSYAVTSPTRSRRVYVTGEVAFNGPTIAADLATFPAEQRTARLRAILMHYVGHIVGLTHTNDIKNILYHGHDGRATEWTVGDLAGLNAVGSGPCEPPM